VWLFSPLRLIRFLLRWRAASQQTFVHLVSLPIALLAGLVAFSSLFAFLIPPAGLAQLLTPRCGAALLGAVAIAVVAAYADRYLAPTPGAVEEARGLLFGPNGTNSLR
jgi:hypothetical protein